MNENMTTILILVLIFSITLNFAFYGAINTKQKRIDFLYEEIYECAQEIEEEVLEMIEENEERNDSIINNILSYAIENEYIFEEYGIRDFYSSSDFDYECSRMSPNKFFYFEESFGEFFNSIEETYYNEIHYIEE